MPEAPQLGAVRSCSSSRETSFGRASSQFFVTDLWWSAFMWLIAAWWASPTKYLPQMQATPTSRRVDRHYADSANVASLSSPYSGATSMNGISSNAVPFMAPSLL